MNTEVAHVTIIDALMGAGKTTHAINRMVDIANPFSPAGQKFMYITPFLAEVDRVIGELRAHRVVDVIDPKPVLGKKSEHLYKLIAEGQNIVATHKLFEHLDPRVLTQISLGNYVLIVDEVTQWVQKYKDMKLKDIKMLLTTGYISVDQQTKRINWHDIDGEPYDGKFQGFRSLCLQGKLVATSVSKAGVPGLLLWELPLDVLAHFSEVQVITYLFEGSDMAAYLKLNRVPYRLTTLDADHNLVEYDPRHDVARLKHVRHLITVVDDPRLNAVGAKVPKEDPLSVSWYERDKEAGGARLEVLKRNLRYFFELTTKTCSRVNMWSSYREFEGDLKGKGYAGSRQVPCFLSCNSRATNDYRHKTALAYAVSINHDPQIKLYYLDYGVRVSSDLYALSTMVQWIWRSAIRDRMPITVYLPSERMRKLFLRYLDGHLPEPTLSLGRLDPKITAEAPKIELVAA